MTESKNRMRNTHVLVNGFNYIRPESVADAVASLTENPDAVLLAGGTNLLVDMKLEMKAPATVIDILNWTNCAAGMRMRTDSSLAR